MAEGVRGNFGPLHGISHAVSSRRMTPLRLRTTALMVAAAFGAAVPGVYANPQGAKVVNGQATITNTGSTLVIKNSPGAIINWQSFSIGKGETTTFIQQSVNSAILNRVIGANPSVILGDLNSNGKVFLINANGVIFGKGAMVDAAGLVVSSLDITDQDFKAGTMRFVGSSASGDISVAGVLRSSDGDVYLIAPNITNTGSIEAVGGNAILAAGQSVEIVGTDASDIKFDVQNTGNTALNLGQISGDAVGIFAGTLTQAGGVNANAFSVSGGKVILTAQGNATLAAGSTTSADNATGTAGSVLVEAQTGTLTVAQGASVSASGARGGFVTLLADQGTNTISGSVAATGTMQLGGAIDVLGANVAVTSGATVDASGAGGGGALVVGGTPGASSLLLAKNTTVANGAALIADATSQGNGGSIDVYGVDTVGVQGSISARGGLAGGNGGTVDTSGAVVEVSGPLTAAARNSNGRAGMWTLDPNSIEIDNYNSTAYSTTPVLNTTTGVSEVNAAYLASVLSGGTSVTLSTSTAPGGSGPTGTNAGYFIDVTSPINVNLTSYGVVLTLNAGGQIDFVSGGGLSATGAALTLNLNSDLAGGTAGVLISAPISIPGGTINITSAAFNSNSTITASLFNAVASSTTATFNNGNGVIDASADDNGQTGSPGGRISISGYSVGSLGTMMADGSSPPYAVGFGQSGGTISIIGAASINDNNGLLSATGGNGTYGSGGTGGTITLATTAGGSLNLTSSTIRVNGGNAGTAYSGGIGGVVSLGSAGDINLSGATISAVGGTGGAGYYGIGSTGGAGGMIGLYAYNGQASIIASDLYVDGGAGSATAVVGPTNYHGGAGGSAGTINVSAEDISLSVSTLSAQGGFNLAAGGSGGAGGTINLSASDSIQDNSGSTLTVAGGPGAGAIVQNTPTADDAGSGGAGGTISITAQNQITLYGTTLSIDGGAGGAGAETTDGQTVSNGGAGGAAGALSITGWYGVTSGGVNISANGGAGGDGGAFNSTGTTATTAGSGGAGGAGGLVTIAALYGSAGVALAETNITAMGGAGGAGASLDPAGLDPLASGGTGGAGGAGGQIVVTSTGTDSAIALTSAQLVVGGGNGGAGGAAESDLGGGGSGGAGGAGATIFGDNDAYAIVLNSSGSITIDTGSSLSAIGGAGGAGQDSSGLVRPTASVGPGTGGDGGDTYGIELQGYNAVNLSGSLTIAGGAGGNGGNLLGAAISPQGTAVIAGGNGGNGGSVYNSLNIAANLDDTEGEQYGTITTASGSTITIVGGAGGNGGLSNDNPTNYNGNSQVYAAGNGGTGGSVDMANMSGYGEMFLAGNITIAGGAGGIGGNVTTTSGQSPGVGGTGGSFSGLTIALNSNEEYGEELYLNGNIDTEVGLGGAAGTVGGVYYYASAPNGNAGTVFLSNSDGDVYQEGGALFSNTSAMNVSASATDGGVFLAEPGNVISTVTGSAQYEFDVASTGNSGVNMTATNITAGYGIELTAYEMTLSGSIQTNYDQINISADNLTAGGLTNLAIQYPNTSAVNTTGTNSYNPIYDWVSIAPITSTQPIIITADSYNSPGFYDQSGSALVIGAEIFSALNAPELVIGTSGGSSTIAFNSLNSTPGTVQMKPGAQLTLYGTSITQDQYTQLSTDYLYITANNVSLSGLTPATSGGTVYITAGVADSGYNDTLNISAASGQKVVIGNLTGTNLNLTTGFSGLQGYEYVTIGADQLSIQSPITMYTGGYDTVALGPVTSGTPAAINPTGGFTGFGLTNDDLANIYTSDGGITIGNSNTSTLAVNGPVTLPNVSYSNLTLTAQGDINFSGSTLTLPTSSLYVSTNGSINDTGMVITASGYIGLEAGYDGSIGAQGAPLYLAQVNSTDYFYAYAGSDIYIQGTANLTGQGIQSDYGTVSIATPNGAFENEDGVYGGTAVNISAGTFLNYAGVQGGTVAVTAGNISNYGNISGSTITLNASNTLYNDGYANISGSSVALTAGSQLNLYGSIYSQGDINLSGGAITIASAGDTGTTVQGQDITINGGSLLVTGDITPPSGHGLRGHYSGDPANNSVLIDANGTLNVTLTGDMTISGGNYAGASASMLSGSNSTYVIGGALEVRGGTQSGAFALLDPTNGATMNISALSINLTGGSADSTYAAIVSAGNVILTAPQYIALHDGSGTNSDAVVIANSGLGTITANTPSCINCEPQSGSYPLTNTSTDQGFYGIAASAPPPAPPPVAPPPPAPPPAPAPQAYGNDELNALIEDLLTLLDTPLNNGNVPPVEAVIFVDGGADGCF